MTTGSDLLVWIDCEMTGLDLSVDELVEIAVVITDFDLNPVDEGLSVVIKPSDAALANMGDFVTTMHTTSGLIEEIPDGLDLADAEFRVLQYVVDHIPDAQKAPLAGNSIGTDRAFLAKFMPRLDAHLHYRNVDVSSVKELARRWYPRAYFNAPSKDGGHRALADILESIRELAYYRSAVFVPLPGPTSDEAKAAAAATVNAYTSNV
ncbi:oligoribonuclease [Labedella gwakjiensis]|uniref:Oligoribonuclease n=1 Tax=Labedella gwakjiensis TaxID=390269 RepID=A0A2P8H0I2_9MICO|nr:oligoribonuclease [Labedella gwakjiensis]PSL39735.1 oligoribonuclease [Labedella gwakjiensis]RUQ85880.1 oligoribonuclease [Labedella gwakjiensis]